MPHEATAHSPTLEHLRDALDSGTLAPVRRMLKTLHPAEIGNLLESLPPTERNFVWDLVDPDDGGETLVHVNDEVRASLIERMADEALLAATDGMEVDDLADLVADLPEAVTQRILLSMDQQNRKRLESVLLYDEDSAGGLMNTDTITVRPAVTVDVVLRYLRQHKNIPDQTDTLFVVNRYAIDRTRDLPLRRRTLDLADLPGRGQALYFKLSKSPKSSVKLFISTNNLPDTLIAMESLKFLTL